MDSINSILRSNIGNKYLYVYESIDKAMNIKARDSEKKVIVLPSKRTLVLRGLLYQFMHADRL